MSNKKSYLVIKDFVGYRLAEYVDYDDAFFTLADGTIIGKGEGFIADITNMDRVIANVPLRPPEELMYLSMPAEDIITFLEQHGQAVDSDLRIRQKLGEPMSKVTLQQIPYIIMGHAKMCEALKKPELRTPVHLIDAGETIGMVIETPEGTGVAPLPPPREGDVDGVIAMTPAGQVVFRFQDRSLLLKNSHTGFVQDFVASEPLEVKTVGELIKENQFIDGEGMLRKSGNNKLVFADISIDGFFPQEV